jgi:predicted MFS family arabinose efflux permease
LARAHHEASDLRKNLRGDALNQAPAVPARTLALLALAAFASAATTRICDGLLPQIAADFTVTTGVAARVITAYSATYGLFQIAWGLVGDRFGKPRIILAGTILSLLATLACGFAATLGQLTTARLVAGAAAAGMIPLSMAWIGDAVPYARRQATIARFIMGQIGGLVAGLALGGIIGELIDWRAAFWIIAAIYVLTSLGLVLEFPREAAPPAARATGDNPLRQVAQLFTRPWVRVVLTMTFLEGFFGFGSLAYVTSMLHGRFGLGFAAAGLTLATFGLGGFLYAFTAGPIVARIGEAGCARAASVCFAIAYVMFALLPVAWLAIVASFFAGLGYYLLHNVLQVNATQMAPEARGAAVAVFATAFFVGQGLGVAAAAPIVDAWGTTPVFLTTALVLPVCALVFAGLLERRA